MAPMTIQLGLLALAGSALAASAGRSGRYGHGKYHHASGSTAGAASASTGIPYGGIPYGGPPGGSVTETNNPTGTNPLGSSPTGSNPMGTNPFGSNPSGTAPFGTAPYGMGNSTNAYGATGTGAGVSPASAASEVTVATTQTVVPVQATSNANTELPDSNTQLPTGVAGSDTGVCVGSTVYQTVTNIATVTVTAGAGDTGSETTNGATGVEGTTTTTPNEIVPTVTSPVDTTTAPIVGSDTDTAPIATDTAPVDTDTNTDTAPAVPPTTNTVAPIQTNTNTATGAPIGSPSAYTSTPAYGSGTSATGSSPTSAPSCAHSKRDTSTKRGCLYNGAGNCTILGSGMSFGLNWAMDSSGLTGMSYAPQLWGQKDPVGNDLVGPWQSGIDAVIQKGGVIGLLGMNEPDRNDQSNLSPQAAANIWSNMQNHGSVPVGSPAVTSTDCSDGSEVGLCWLSSFASKVGQEAFDFVQVHFYQDCTVDQNDYSAYFEKFMNDAHTQNNNKDVWVTELGCLQMTSMPSDDQISGFMSYAMNWLDSTEFIKYYAWDMAAPTDSKSPWNLIGDNDQPSQFGSQYQTGATCN